MVSELYLKKENPLNNWAYAMLSQMYIALPFALLNVLAFHSDETASLSQYNAILPLSIFIFNWVNDTGAYCTGMLFGKHKLFERISPKKSWEGSIGGGIFCIIASFLLFLFFLKSVPLPFLSRKKRKQKKVICRTVALRCCCLFREHTTQNGRFTYEPSVFRSMQDTRESVFSQINQLSRSVFCFFSSRKEIVPL